MPHTHLRLTAASLIAALACCLFVTSGRTQTGVPLRLTNTPPHVNILNPTVSGDGRRIAFESSADLDGAGGAQGFRAFLADVSGAAPAIVRLAVTRARAAAVSQDGARVAFASAEDLTGANRDRNLEIFLHDGAALNQLTATTPDDATTRTRDGNFQPSLSDDGRLVAFSSNRDLVGANADGNFEIFVYDMAARAFTQLTNSVGVFGASDAKMSGDVAHVAYVRDDTAPGAAADARRDLLLLDRRTNAPRVVAEDAPGLALTPGRAISDDGSRIVYAAEDAAGASQVFLFDGRNGITRQLTALGTRAADVPLHPTISGDGARVAFATRRSVFTGEPGGGVDLFLIDLPTNRLSRVTAGAPSRATAEVVSSLDDAGSVLAYNFPRVSADPAVPDEFANTSEIFLARLDARPPFSTDLEILHGASLTHAPDKLLAAGQIAVARGTNLAPAPARALPAADKTFPRGLNGTVVTVNQRPAQIFYVSPTQINFQIPDETEIGAAQVVARNHDGYESRAEINIAPAAPGVFTENGDGRGTAVALDSDNQLRGPFNPADAANGPRRLSIFATGLRRARSVTVTAAGIDLPVETIVPSPDLPGLDEIHVRLQRRLAGAGVVPLVITADTHAGNATSLHFVGARRPARVLLTPPSAALGVGRTLRFSAAVFDADDFEIAGAHVTYSSSDETVATVDATGRARGIGVGIATIRASAGEVSAGAELRVHALSLVLNEVLADPPDGAAGDANRDGSRNASQDEFVEIVNASDVDLDLGGFTLATRTPGGARTTRHVFAAGNVLSPGTAAVVFGGATQTTFNPNDPAFGGALVSTASTGGLSLANGGATITLHDPSDVVVEEMSYGDAGGFDGDRNQSLTRAPDVAGDFSLHLSAAPAASARAFSPGTKLDGMPFELTAPAARIEISPASSTVQTGASQQFTARAFGADGRELPGVIFRWHSSDAGVAVVDGAGLARGLKAGTARIVARARGIESPPASLTVVTPPPRVVRVEVSPATASVNRGGSQTFTARAFDRDEQLVPDAVFSWVTSDASIATIDPNGLARGVGVGAATLTATTPDGAGGAVSSHATLSVRVPLVLNELLADVPPDDAATAAAEGDANRDGVRRADDDEFVELLNVSNSPVELSGLRLSDSTSTRFTFPAGAILAAGRSVVVFGGGDPPVNDPAFGGALVFAAASLGLNDGGDTVALKLTAGNEDVTILSQPFGAQGGPPAPVNASLSRSPDAEVNAEGGGFIAHSSAQNAAGRVFSPGTRPDGTPFGSPPLTRIIVSPSAASLDIGSTRVFAATAYAQSGGAETPIDNVSFVWDVNDTSKAAPAPPTGQTTSLAALDDGTVTLRARAGGLEATAVVTVNPPPPVLTRVELSPAAASLSVGESRQFDARAFDQYGQLFPVESFVFTSSAADKASVDSVSFTPGSSAAVATVTGRAAGAAQLTAVATAASRSVKSNEATVTANNPPPAVARVEVSPASAAIGVGATRQFTARAFEQNGQEMTGVSFNWATSDANVASIDAVGLATGVNPGAAQIRASAGAITSPPAGLSVAPPPVPSAGQVIINEALVAFTTSTTQPRADFVELYNTTDLTLDISGITVSFRPGGNTNTVRTITLPGASGSDTLRIRPRGYFLIVNGAQTFGASISTLDGRPDGFDASGSATDIVAGVGTPSPCAGTTNCFDLNGSSGAIKIEIGGTKLDGLTYQSGATPPAAPFNSYGEGAILIYTSGATNDLIRTPNAADTNNNAADFKRNGATGSVTPKAANP